MTRKVLTVVGARPQFIKAAAVSRAPDASNGHRFVALKMAGRRVALAVDEVLGVRQIDAQQLSDVPPLLAAAPEPVVSAIATLDAELLMVLRSSRLVPEPAWAAIDAGGDR